MIMVPVMTVVVVVVVVVMFSLTDNRSADTLILDFTDSRM